MGGTVEVWIVDYLVRLAFCILDLAESQKPPPSRAKRRGSKSHKMLTETCGGKVADRRSKGRLFDMGLNKGRWLIYDVDDMLDVANPPVMGRANDEAATANRTGCRPQAPKSRLPGKHHTLSVERGIILRSPNPCAGPLRPTQARMMRTHLICLANGS